MLESLINEANFFIIIYYIIIMKFSNGSIIPPILLNQKSFETTVPNLPSQVELAREVKSYSI